MFIPDTGSQRPLYEQLYRYFRDEIESGRMKSDERLPSRRKLSSDFRLSPGTVENAYAQLLAEGYVYSREKSGYYVSRFDAPFKSEPAGHAANVFVAAPEWRHRFSLETNAVDTENFPFATWAKLMRETLSRDNRSLLSPTDPQGDFDLRKEIVRYLGKYRGIEASDEQIVLGAGSEFLLGLLVQLLGRGRVFGIENPGYPKTGKILRANGAVTDLIPVDRQGLDACGLERSPASVVHVTPSHHFPLAVVMPVARRMRLLRWASASPDRYIVEDDYDTEFRFAGKPIPALQCLDRGAGRVVYMNTFAKSLSPSLRIGYMVLPPELLAKYREALSFYACSVPNFEQRTLWRFLERGHFERHLSRMKTIYRMRRDTFIEWLTGRTDGGIAVGGEDTGLHLLVTVKNGMSEGELVSSAALCGVEVHGMSEYYGDCRKTDGERSGTATVVLGYAGHGEEDLKEAAALLRRAWFGS